MTYFILFTSIVFVLVAIYVTNKRTKAKVFSDMEKNAEVYKAYLNATLLLEEIDDALEYTDELKAQADAYWDAEMEEIGEAQFVEMMQEEMDDYCYEIIMEELEDCDDEERINELLDALNRLGK